METIDYIGITEGADPTINHNWETWVIKDKKPAILITKAPSRLLDYLTGQENIIIHCTITGLGGTKVEPRIKPPEQELIYYHKLCDLFEKERVVLRIDPIIPGFTYQENILHIAEQTEDRLRISFMDNYDHVKYRFTKAGLSTPYTTFNASQEQRESILEDIDYRLENLGKSKMAEVCCEIGLPSLPCISEVDCKILGVEPSRRLKSQRPFCGCLANKKELCGGAPKCTYGCLYCYWRD
jgi:DNA repair photolyase